MTATATAEAKDSFDWNATHPFQTDNLVAIPATSQADKTLIWSMNFISATDTEKSTDITLRASVNDKDNIYFNVSDTQKWKQRQASEKSLAEALSELEELDDYAAEEDLPPPSPIAKNIARGILNQLTSILPRYYAVSPWEDGDIVVFSEGSGSRVSVFCRANGGASLYVNFPNNRDYEHHCTLAEDLPVDSVIDALEKIPTPA